MLRSRKFIVLLVSILLSSVSPAQHPNTKKIDSLKNLLPIANGIQKIDCLNALCQEYWLLAKNYYSDTISGWANLAYKEATSTMLDTMQFGYNGGYYFVNMSFNF